MIQTEPFTSSKLVAAIRTIYFGGKNSKFKVGGNGPSKLTNGMVALAVVIVSNLDLIQMHHDKHLTSSNGTRCHRGCKICHCRRVLSEQTIIALLSTSPKIRTRFYKNCRRSYKRMEILD